MAAGDALHLIEPRSAPWSDLRSCAALLDGEGAVQHTALLIGGGRGADPGGARLGRADRLTPALGRPELGARSMRRYLRVRGAPDVIVAWSARCAALAARAAPGLPLAVVLSTPPPALDAPNDIGMLAVRAVRHASILLFPSGYLRDVWVARYTLLGSPSAVVPPRVDASLPDPAVRDRLRAGWGAADREAVVALCIETDGAIDARSALLAASILAVAGVRASVLIPPGASRLVQALRLAERLTAPVRVLVEDRPLPVLLDGCDLGLWIEPAINDGALPWARFVPRSGTVGLAWAAAAGLPIVAQKHPAAVRMLGSYPNACFVGGASKPETARAMLSMLERGRMGSAGGPGLHPVEWRGRLDRMLLRVRREHAHRVARGAVG